MKNLNLFPAILLFLAVSFSACNTDVKLTPDEARGIAKEAYIYGFPMVVNYKTMYLSSVLKDSPAYKGPFNQLSCDARLFTPEDKSIVTPNSDTPYCMFWVDLRKEPYVISLPEMEPERFYHFQLIDLYTHNFAYLGTLTTGNKPGKYLIAPHSWEGEIPDGIDEVLRCETDIFFTIVRTQLMDPNDIDNVKRIQGEYGLESLSAFLGEDPPEVEMSNSFPDWIEGDQFTASSFKYLDFMICQLDPVQEETELIKKFGKLGIGTGDGFDMDSFDEETQKAIEEGVKNGFEEIEEFISTYTTDPLISAKIFGTREFLEESGRENFQLEDFYILRAVAAHRGLYGNSGTEAIYPTYLMETPGIPFNAADNKYTITFGKDELPPVNSFWSLTMYDGQTQLFIHNQLDRYLLNSSMMDDYLVGEDGSLTLYLQKDSPGPKLESNWLPAPNGPFYAVLRLYGPMESALTGEWINPPLVKSE